MHRPDISTDLIFLSILLVPIIVGMAFSQEGPDDTEVLNQLVLNIYIDDAGRALINGYIDDPGALAYLNSSEYTYEDDSRQLYAITSALTSKSRDNWTLSFESRGIYDEYQIMLYLPENAKLRWVNCSFGLDYLVYAANESVIAEVQGYNITDPAVNIEYLLPLAEASGADAEIVTDSDAGYLHMSLALFVLLAAGFGILIFLLRSRRESTKSELSTPAEQQTNTGDSAKSLKEDAEGSSRISKIAVVMDTLTDKEQSIIRALLKHGGSMTQKEIGYETDISKSSLSGILTSLEKRKIITKKGKGRANVIELSKRFSNNQERS